MLPKHPEFSHIQDTVRTHENSIMESKKYGTISAKIASIIVGNQKGGPP
jgi:hypothetical protein